MSDNTIRLDPDSLLQAFRSVQRAYNPPQFQPNGTILS